MSSVKSMGTPMHPSSILLKDDKGTPISEKEYIWMIGSLLYLTASRPDIVFAVGLCASFQSFPKESHLIAVKMFFRYLRGTINLGSWYKKCSNLDITTYCDADYAGDKVERKNTTRACQCLGKSLISWSCKKQGTIVLSTTKVEYVSAAQCWSHLLWIKNQLEDFSLRSHLIFKNIPKDERMAKHQRTQCPFGCNSPCHIRQGLHAPPSIGQSIWHDLLGLRSALNAQMATPVPYTTP
ncbi:secreted RxLR effector protein 161-like [Cicer arietinum]|uniref:secreted RxLR effector protein 161-like n=1 Tax=Cicer arietinum TaxID=3827 RepID=UPI003CC6DC28